MLAVVAVALLGAAALLLLADAPNLLVVALLAAAAVAGLAAWANERAAARRHAALEEKRRGEMDERSRRFERQVEEQRAELQQERRLRLRTERARRAEREWTRELREQVLNLYRSRGPSGDLRELVLEVAIQVTGARRGLLLSQRDGDGDGRLDLVCHRGFRSDPTDSALAQRFAERVMERDEIIREDSPGPGDGASDSEIDSLVAVPVFMRDDFEGVVVCADRPGGFEEVDDDVLLALGDHAGAVLENHGLHGRLRSSYLAVVRILADAIEAKDPFVRTHSDQVSACIEGVGRRLDLSPDACERLVFAGLLRDVGKLGISDRVLLKPAPLTAEERRIVELHPLIGCRLVERIPGLAGLAPAIRHHHERWDGSGYPTGLSGERIPVEARVLALADAYSAMTSTRPYRRPIASQEACRELERCAGSQFDPTLARHFVEEIERRTPEESDGRTLAEALDVPAVQAWREHDEPLLGHGSVASIDHVTLLYSHRYLQEVASAEAARAGRRRRPFAVVMVELTNLSEINRREGYAAGDHALQELAHAIERELDGMPATAGRFSGRRLAIVLPAAGHNVAAAVAARVAESFNHGGPPVRTGIAVWQHGDHGEDVIARARLALDETPAVAH
jgi:diguanylate cyclase (GGDEF)-like protein